MGSNDRRTRRTALKSIAAVGFASPFWAVGAANPDGSDPEPDCSGGDPNVFTIDRSVRSEFYNGSGTSYTSAGSAYEQISDHVWIGDKWTVDYHTWAYACNSYELDDGSTGVDPMFSGQHRIIVDVHDKEHLVSTQPYDDADWGVSVVRGDVTNPDVDDVLVDAANKILTNMAEGVSAVVNAIDVYNRLHTATVDGDIDKTWYPPERIPRAGHYLRWNHTYPPRDEIGERSISCSVENRLLNSVYDDAIDWTGHREPTDDFEHTFDYTLYVPTDAPDQLSLREREEFGITKKPASETNNSRVADRGDELVWAIERRTADSGDVGREIC